MRTLKWTVGSLLGFVALVAAVGMLLSGTYKVERSIEIAAPPGKIFPLINDPRAWARWTVWNQRDRNMRMTYEGSVAGAGARWKWESKLEGSGEMIFTRADPPKALDYELYFPEFESRSSGTLSLQPSGAGTRLVWSNEGKLEMKPLGGYVALFMDRMVGPDFEGGLANLKALAEKP